jgi:membrane fusion protein (multidrug efflux system)
MYVDFSMGVAELAQIRLLGQGGAQSRVQVLLPDGTPYAQQGQLDFSGDVVDPATGAVQLRARVANPDGVLLPGTFVTLKAVLGEERNAFLVPQGAVQRDAQGAYVLVVGKDGKVARKAVVTERAQGADWVVREGVAEGDQVIVSGLQRAVPGQPAKAAPVASDGEPPAGQAPAKQGAAPAPAKG